MYLKISTCTQRPTEKMSEGLERKQKDGYRLPHTQTSSHSKQEGSK